MALSRAGLIVDTTSTAGTGTYTLNDPADPGDGFRTLADAVADGHVSNGDTVYYWIKDTTTQGGTLAFEHGIGTVGSSGATLARTEIIESSNGDAEVNWGSGGSRTVVIGVGVSGLALLAAANTFTAVQALNEGATATKSTDGNFLALSASNTNTGADANATIRASTDASSGASVNLSAHGSGRTGTSRFGATLAGRSEVLAFTGTGLMLGTLGALDVRIGTNSTLALRIDSSQELWDGAGAKLARQGVLSAPSGGRLLWLSTSVPTGWSVVASTADKTILTTETAADASTTGGSWTISGLSGSTTVDNATVTVNNATLTEDATGTNMGGLNVVIQETHTHTTVAHNHSASTSVSSGSAWRPAWIKGLVIVKS